MTIIPQEKKGPLRGTEMEPGETWLLGEEPKEARTEDTTVTTIAEIAAEIEQMGCEEIYRLTTPPWPPKEEKAKTVLDVEVGYRRRADSGDVQRRTVRDIFEAVRHGDTDPMLGRDPSCQTLAQMTANIRRLSQERKGLDGQQLKTAEAAYRAGKVFLPAAMFSATFGGRGDGSVDTWSGLVFIDVDHVGDGRVADDMRKAFSSPHVAAVWRSPGGDGLRVIVNIGRQESADDHRVRFDEAMDLMVRMGLRVSTLDAKARNPERACFITHDPDIMVREDSVPLPQEAIARRKAKAEADRVAANEAREARALEHARRLALLPAGQGKTPAIEADIMRYCLNFIGPDDYDNWLKVGFALKECGSEIGDQVAKDLWDGWSSRSGKYEQHVNDKTWDRADQGGGVSRKTIIALAKEDAAYDSKMAVAPGGSLYNWCEKAYGQKWEDRVMRQAEQPVPTDGESWTFEQQQEKEAAASRSLRKVPDSEVKAIVMRSNLGPLMRAVWSSYADEPPFRLTLAKVLPLAGCALTSPLPSHEAMARAPSWAGAPWGKTFLKLKICTGDSQPAAFWTMSLSRSGSGKDLGSLNEVQKAKGWHLGDSGSAEGIADALMEHRSAGGGNAMLSLGELKNFLDKNSWEHKATNFLNSTFTNCCFKQSMAKSKGKSNNRESDFAVLNLSGNIQPRVVAEMGAQAIVSNGFFQRFLVLVNKESWVPCPAAGGPAEETKKMAAHAEAVAALDRYQQWEGDVHMPARYMDRLRQLTKHLPEPADTACGRIVNEYGPRLAVVLARSPSQADVEAAIPDAEVVVEWLMGQMVEAVGQADMDEDTAKVNAKVEALVAMLKRSGGSATPRDITRVLHVTAKWRDTVLLPEAKDAGAVELELSTTGGDMVRRVRLPQPQA